MRYESEYYGICNLGYSISHHGIKGQKWYRRRFQNEDNTLTPAGKERYGTGTSLDTGSKLSKLSEKGKTKLKEATTLAKEHASKFREKGAKQYVKDRASEIRKEYGGKNSKAYEKRARAAKKALMIAGGVAVGAIVARQVIKHRSIVKDNKFLKQLSDIDYESNTDRIRSSRAANSNLLHDHILNAKNQERSFSAREASRTLRANNIEARRQMNMQKTYKAVGRTLNVERHAKNAIAATGGYYLYSKYRAKKARKKAIKR